MKLKFAALFFVCAVSGCHSSSVRDEVRDDPWETRVAEAGLGSALRVMAEAGNVGSGFFIHPSGLAVTNAHVVAGGQGGTVQVAVGDSPGWVAPFEILARGDSRDLALLRVRVPHPVDYSPIGLSAPLQLGSPLLAVGAPQGMFPVVTTGVLSGRLRPGSIAELAVPEQLVHSAATLRGSSGCAVLSEEGRVIGVQSAKPSMELVKISDGEGEEGPAFDRQLGRWAFQTEGFGLAIPIEDLRSFAPSWIAPEWSTGLETGFQCDALRDGCYVVKVDEGAPAEAAGLRVGDLIVSCNGMRVLSVVDLSVWLDSGQRLSLGVVRDKTSSVIAFDRDRWAAPTGDLLAPGLLWKEQLGARTRLEGAPLGRASDRGVVKTIRLGPGHVGRDAFSLELKAWLKVPAAGRWVFELTSDDGSQLYVRDKLVVDCDGLHGARPVRGEIELGEGLQPIRVLFFEAGGDESLKARWGLLGEELRDIPDAAFFHATGSGW